MTNIKKFCKIEERRKLYIPLTLNKQDFTFSGKSFNITEEKNKLFEPYNKQIWNYGIVIALIPNEIQKERLNKENVILFFCKWKQL